MKDVNGVKLKIGDNIIYRLDEMCSFDILSSVVGSEVAGFTTYIHVTYKNQRGYIPKYEHNVRKISDEEAMLWMFEQ